MCRVSPLLLVVAGCAPNLEGWWDLASVEVSRGSDSDRREDAGFAVFDQYGAVDLGLSYAFDPVALELVPDPTPDIVSYSSEYDPTPEGEPDLALYLGSYYAEFDVLKYRSTSLVLESIPAYDDTQFVLELRR